MTGGRGWIDGWKDGNMDVGRGCMDKRKGWLDRLMGRFGDIMYECQWISVITLGKKGHDKQTSLDKLEIKSKSK